MAQLVGQGQRLTQLGGVAWAGRAITRPGGRVVRPYPHGRTGPGAAAGSRRILVTADHIEVGEDLSPVRDPALIEGRLPLGAIRLVGFAVTVPVPLVHQNAVVDPAELEVVRGVAASDIALDQHAIVPPPDRRYSCKRGSPPWGQ